MSLEKQRAAKSKLTEKLAQRNKDIRQYNHDLKKLDKRIHRSKLIEAGTLFDKAGILYSYNPERVLNILRNLEHVTLNQKQEGNHG